MMQEKVCGLAHKERIMADIKLLAVEKMDQWGYHAASRAAEAKRPWAVPLDMNKVPSDSIQRRLFASLQG